MIEVFQRTLSRSQEKRTCSTPVHAGVASTLLVVRVNPASRRCASTNWQHRWCHARHTRIEPVEKVAHQTGPVLWSGDTVLQICTPDASHKRGTEASMRLDPE